MRYGRSHSLVADLAHFEEAAAEADVALLDIVGAVHDRGSRGAGHSVLICLAQTAEGSDTRLQEIMLRQVRHALLSDHDVGLECNNLGGSNNNKC